MAKIQTCDNWLAKLLACAILMIYGNSVHISRLKNAMCDIWKAKMFSVIFCQRQTTVSIVSVTFFRCVDSTNFPFFVLCQKMHFLRSNESMVVSGRTFHAHSQKLDILPLCFIPITWHSISLFSAITISLP